MNVIRSLALMAALAAPAFAQAQSDFPRQQIRVLVGFPAGGSTDVLARMTAQEARRLANFDMIVVNRPGATSTIAMNEVANAAPDGYTIGIVPSGVMTLTHLFQNTRPDLLEATSALMVAGKQRTGLSVKADSPIRTMKDFVAAARANPGKMSVGTPGAGTTVSLILRAIFMQEKIDAPLVPMNGDAPVVVALLGGHVSAGTTSAAGFAEHIRAGTMRLIASMEDERSDVAPDVQTLIEQGYDYHSGTLQYYMAPKGIAPDIRKKLIDVLIAATSTPAFVDVAKKNSLYGPSKMTGDELDAYFLKEREKAVALAGRLGVKREDAK